MKKFFILLSIAICSNSMNAQEQLYTNSFPLSDVKLLDGPFKHACDLNTKVLLQYDTDRLLAPFLKEAGLTPKGESFENWIGLDGHVGGHYVSALAIHYVATGNKECKERMDYVLSELKRCQDANGDGYVGGVPQGRSIWNEIKGGNPGVVWKHWVPWYNLHKTYAGLRDAWLYGGSSEARKMFLDLCDWGLTIIAPLDDEQMEAMLANEFGGMNEVYADAYQMTNDKKYLDAAKRFSHKAIFDSMVKHVDNLDNKHANTQVPKAVGYQRVAELSGEKDYVTATEFFWEAVALNRSLSFGGNSRREHFPSKEDCCSYTEEREGPETCNTNNMLKLTEGLFRMNPEARYADFYERAMFNHILSSQHPEHGGYVYFTSARPSHYRVYSAPNQAMWCCVGTGMENHGKYGEFVYTKEKDALYVNLFMASELNWKEKKATIIQHTSFPEEEQSKLTVRVGQKTKFKMKIRYPWWTTGMKVVCDGVDYAQGGSPSSYIEIDRTWKDGDVVEITFPMNVTIEEMPNVSDYISILRGPVVMAVKTGAERLDGLVAGDGRWEHIAHGPLVSIFQTPLIIGERSEIERKLNNLQPVSGQPMTFTVPGLFNDTFKDLKLEPFYRVHDSRYAIYWLAATPKEYEKMLEEQKAEERKKLILDARTIDAVNVGEQQPEVDHQMQTQNSTTGVHEGEAWRDARDGGYIQYTLDTKGYDHLSLMARYWGNDSGHRTFDILIDGELLVTENIVGKWNRNEFLNHEYKIPEKMLKGKSTITIKFLSKKDQIAGGISYLRLLVPEEQINPETLQLKGK